MYALLILCALSIGHTQDKINKDITPHNETRKAAPKAKNKPFPVVTGDTPSHQPNSPSHSDQNNTGPDNRVNRIEVVPQADSWFKGYVIATFCIAGINIAVLIAVWRQKIIMSGQLGVMQQQAHNAAEQVIAAQCTNNRISHQIRIMQTANEQTNRLIEETRISADAAKRSADALVNSERAWISTDFVPTDPSKYAYNMLANNVGRTLGKVEKTRIGFSIINPYERPKEPFVFDLNFPEENFIILPTQLLVIKKFILTDYFSSEWTAIGLGEKQAIVFSSIEYRDMNGDQHESFMCYSYSLTSFQLEDLRFCRKYK